jgi:hypothetical protein
MLRVREEHAEWDEEQDRDQDELAVPLDQTEHWDSAGAKFPCILTCYG